MGKNRNRRFYGENAKNNKNGEPGNEANKNASASQKQNAQAALQGEQRQNGQKQPVQNVQKQNAQNGQNAKPVRGDLKGNQGNRFRENGAERQKKRPHGAQKGGGKAQNAEEKKDTYVYELDGKLYINLTNKCSNGCEFCVRNERTTYYGHHLWIRHGDPSAEAVIAALNEKDLDAYKELVFCGFGEPTYKMQEMLAVAEFAHEKGLKTRLNTNGQGNLINKHDITAEFKGKIDFVNVSLNAPDAESYQKICHSMFRLDAFPALVEFAKSCAKNGVPCRFSVVDCIGEEAVAACKRLADAAKIPLYVRKYIADS